MWKGQVVTCIVLFITCNIEVLDDLIMRYIHRLPYTFFAFILFIHLYIYSQLYDRLFNDTVITYPYMVREHNSLLNVFLFHCSKN